MATQYFSVKETSEILNCSEQYVRQLLRYGEISGERISSRWIVASESVQNYSLKKEDTSLKIHDHGRRAFSKPGLKALSFFSGCMGLDLGLEKEGIQVLLASEIDAAARKTIEINRPDIALIGDIRDYSAAEIREKAGLSITDEIDVIVGGPPCQAFSSAGKRQGFNDERGNVFLTFINLIIELKPRFAVIENVRGLLSAPLKHRPHEMRGKNFPPLSQDEQRGGALLFITQRLKEAGYSVSFNLYNAANFGSPQRRERVVIACSRDGKKLPYLTPTNSEQGLYGLPIWKKLREALKDLPKDGHHFVKFPEKRLKYYRLLKAGQYWRDLPEELHQEALGNSYHAGGGKTGFYRRLAWDKPAPTLVTHPAMPATDLAHPEEDRPLSIEEYKRIQEFPDDWMIAGTLLDQYRQVGNAVPSSLGRAIARMLLSYLRGESPVAYPDFPYSRYNKTDDVSWMKDMGYLENASTKQLSLNLV
ncbi:MULTISPECIES: DNA cytosine methyltransferase [Synechocystis]|uniref:Cytosine-specific methyltransferase n=1 Tax=Synechocystis salina LEGE 00031 TaxID=1828736 RepID=A0ABR9VP44_9SYNC|nr:MULTISPECIES: DNA cytosine methyltransferase [Synechocystis]MBE9196361.1 DNA cytosine methyltransferase [Synechocystis sp. LEGE 06083]MBE9241056.1 DNA cytosine methyltransferase [Synechocystis salina LEGE 00041]MBE9253095.1 DNA cytosine methyltransferase [Synechocystis salina LEGE 00031]